MKKVIYPLLIISVLFFGCSDEDERTPPKSDSASTNSVPIDPKSLVDTKSETTLAVDEIGGQDPNRGVPISVKTPSFYVRGWAIDQRTKSLAGGVIIQLDGKDYLADYGTPRPDVADTLKNPDYLKSGFTASIDSAAMGKGKHTLVVRVVTADKKGYYQQNRTYDVIVE
jgi:hypothetical protein